MNYQDYLRIDSNKRGENPVFVDCESQFMMFWNTWPQI
ncbi:hypothetical protein SAMN05421636_107134 [Pricia antarctica]|uniref:Uncharacterized protein n=1 Tax=Pricia antarctica TaxID=641691 RepID=A0A1G7FI77_9FLAO|nr:hypothetical protein SAMN05421636_107134 [Pricia antarctica]